MRNPTVAILSALLPGMLAAQNFDAIGVTFQGQILRIDTATGATSPLGAGQLGQNGLAMTPDGRLWTTVRTGVGQFRFHLAVIDPLSGVETLPFGTADVGDLRGMCEDADGQLLAVRDLGGPDELVRIDPQSGAVTVIGPTGFNGLQALDNTVLGVRAWDLNAGLVQIDTRTGAATDPFPTIAGPANLQWLATDPSTGRCLVGRTTMQQVNLFDGTTSAAVSIAGAPDLRGVEFTTGLIRAIGTGCGPSPRMSATFVRSPSLALATRSPAPAGTFGVQILGLSSTTHLGQTLPVDLDPLLGTVGCRLNVSIDATQFGVANVTNTFGLPFALPANLSWFELFAQHATFDASAPGGVFWTHGVGARTPL